MSLGNKIPGYPSPPFKIIILDEADNMTDDAQNALRRTMETFSHVTRFILICNYITKLIEPINSRCTKFRFQTISGNVIKKQLMDITQKENFSLNSKIISNIVSISKGDMRYAIMLLQMALELYGENIDVNDINNLIGAIPEKEIFELMEEQSDQITEQIEIEKAERLVRQKELQDHIEDTIKR